MLDKVVPRLSTFLQTATTDALYHAETCYLFIVRDIKALMLPVTVFAHFAAPEFVPLRSLLVVFWVSLHLLMFTTCNQSSSPEEDEFNKPWRPIPAGRISERAARRLSTALYVVCALVSVYLGVALPSITLCCLTACYNRLHMDKHWFLKNIINAGGFSCFELGATILAAGSNGLSISGYKAVLNSALIVFTTIHIQDFEDEEGDRAMGRKTMALRWGHNLTRGSVIVVLFLWSIYPPVMKGLPWPLNVPYLVFAVSLGWRSYYLRTPDDDRLTYNLYNVWLAIAHFSILTSSKL